MSLVTHYADPGPLFPSRQRPALRGQSAVSTVFLGGVVAAGLGLGAFAVGVLMLWIISPYPDSGPTGALRVAADLWLLAHGAELVRTETLSGAPAPVGLTPLLLSLVPCTLLYRTARHALEPVSDEPPEEEEDGRFVCVEDLMHADEAAGTEEAEAPSSPAPDPAPATRLPVRTALGVYLGGYLFVGTAAALYAAPSPVHVSPLSALLHLPLFAALFAAAGMWAAAGWPAWSPAGRARRVVDAVPGWVRRWFTRRRVIAILWTAAVGTAALLAEGMLVVAVSLAVHAGGVREAFAQIAAGWAGRVSVGLLSFVLLPNAVVWAVAYVLGAGFGAGTGSVVAPLAVQSHHPALPHFPLLAALPGPGAAGAPAVVATVVLSVAAGAAVAHAAVPGRPVVAGRREVTVTAALGAVLCSVVVTLLAYASAGSLGTSVLTRFGPSCLHTGEAALMWTASVGVPGALVLRWLRRRAERGAGAPAAEAVDGAVPAPPRTRARARAKRRPVWPVRVYRATAAWFGFAVGGGADGPAVTYAYASETLPLKPTVEEAAAAASAAPEADAEEEEGTEADVSPPARRRRAKPQPKRVFRGRRRKATTHGAVPIPGSVFSASYHGPPAEAWHETGSRRVRWAALKESGGGLMPDFEPQDGDAAP
ncbi:cell division protein PerM [Streptomyces sp. NPDC002536]